MVSIMDINGNDEARRLNRERIAREKPTVVEIFAQQEKARRDELDSKDRNIENCEMYHRDSKFHSYTKDCILHSLPCDRGVKKFSQHTVEEHRKYYEALYYAPKLSQEEEDLLERQTIDAEYIAEMGAGNIEELDHTVSADLQYKIDQLAKLHNARYENSKRGN